MSLIEAESFWKQEKTEKYGVISITDPKIVAHLGEDNKRVDTLTLRYHDVGSAWDIGIIPNAVYFTEKDAERILDFTEIMQEIGVKTIVIHCIAGISRSCATAVALETIYGKGQNHESSGEPNVHVAKTIINTHAKRTGLPPLPLPRAWREISSCKKHPSARIFVSGSMEDLKSYCSLCKENATETKFLDLLSGEIQNKI